MISRSNLVAAWKRCFTLELGTMQDKKKDSTTGTDTRAAMRTFNTGATRDLDTSKPDYEGFLSPLVLVEFGKYMTKHRHQADGSLRDSDNWQKGIPLPVYMKSLWRHFMDLWRLHRHGHATDHTGKAVTFEDTLAAIFFNTQGYFHEHLKKKAGILDMGDTAGPSKPSPEKPIHTTGYVSTLQQFHDRQNSLIGQFMACHPGLGFEEKEAPLVLQGNIDRGRLVELGCPDEVARHIVGGITYANCPNPGEMPYVYLAGPMRGYPGFNFPAFDKVRNEWVARGVNVISPADIDRAAGDAQSDNQSTFVHRDFFAIYFLKKLANPNNAVVFLDGWEKSTGAFGEFGLARWLGLQLVGARGPMRNMSFVKLTDAIMDTLVKQ